MVLFQLNLKSLLGPNHLTTFTLILPFYLPLKTNEGISFKVKSQDDAHHIARYFVYFFTDLIASHLLPTNPKTELDVPID